MTTVCRISVKCGLCGKESQQHVMTSTSCFGPPGLDLRPAEPERSSIRFWVQMCPSCGYCAEDISEVERNDETRAVVESNEYRKLGMDSCLPYLARNFLRWSMIQDKLGRYVRAAWTALYAAWACDDGGYQAQAEQCREKALALFKKARSAGQRFGENVGFEEALMGDLLRRMGHFAEAIRMCEEGLRKGATSIERSVLMLEIGLAKAGDKSCHKVPEGALESLPDSAF